MLLRFALYFNGHKALQWSKKRRHTPLRWSVQPILYKRCVWYVCISCVSFSKSTKLEIFKIYRNMLNNLRKSKFSYALLKILISEARCRRHHLVQSTDSTPTSSCCCYMSIQVVLYSMCMYVCIYAHVNMLWKHWKQDK